MNLSNEKIIHVKKENYEFLQFKRLLRYPNIAHAYSVGIDKNFRTFSPSNSSLICEQYKKSLSNYESLCKLIDLNNVNIIKARQNHTDNIINIEEIQNNDTIDTLNKVDGLITNKSNIALATTNADCILFMFYDPINNVIANVHSGWKGTLQEISVKTIKKMNKIYKSKAKDIIVCICPSIRKCHFEVSKDVYKLFYNKFKELNEVDNCIMKSDTEEKWFIDTVLINKIILKQAGILEENIEDSGICSVCNKNLIHSYRAEGEGYGLATAIISIK